MRLAHTGLLDWDLLLGYFARRAIGGVEAVDPASGAYRRTIVVGGTVGTLELTRGGPDHLVLRTDRPARLVVPRARRIFSLDADPRAAADHLAGDPDLAPLVAARPGLRVPGTWDPFETGVRAIVGQQVSVAGASTVTARIVARAGSLLDRPASGLTSTFPGPAVLAEADLSGVGMPGARVAAVQAFAAAVASGDLRLDGSLGLEDLVAAVCAIRGLGPWTASYLALRMGEADAFPAADLGLRRALSPSAPLSTAELSARAEAWRPWRGQAALRLWLGDEAPPSG